MQPHVISRVGDTTMVRYVAAGTATAQVQFAAADDRRACHASCAFSGELPRHGDDLVARRAGHALCGRGRR